MLCAGRGRYIRISEPHSSPESQASAVLPPRYRLGNRGTGSELSKATAKSLAELGGEAEPPRWQSHACSPVLPTVASCPTSLPHTSPSPSKHCAAICEHTGRARGVGSVSSYLH